MHPKSHESYSSSMPPASSQVTPSHTKPSQIPSHIEPSHQVRFILGHPCHPGSSWFVKSSGVIPSDPKSLIPPKSFIWVIPRVSQRSSYPCHPDSSRVIPTHSESSQVSLSHAKSSQLSDQVIPSHPKSYQVIPSHPKSYQVIPSHTKSSQVIPNHAKPSFAIPSRIYNIHKLVSGWSLIDCPSHTYFWDCVWISSDIR